MLKPTLPRAFIIKPDGSTTLNTDYFTSVELTKTDPQVVTYTINPEAVWSDGTPITWEDIKAQIHALSGKDKALLDRQPRRCRTRRVRDSRSRRPAGRDDVRQAVRGMEGHVLGQRNAAAPQHDVDPRGVQQSATQRPRTVGRTVHRHQGGQVGPADRADAQPELVGSRLRGWTRSRSPSSPRRPTYRPCRTTRSTRWAWARWTTCFALRAPPGISIRRAPGATWNHFTFNGAPGSILADQKLRLAIMKAIDRQAIANVSQRGLVDNPTPLNNHIYVAGQEGYQRQQRRGRLQPRSGPTGNSTTWAGNSTGRFARKTAAR